MARIKTIRPKKVKKGSDKESRYNWKEALKDRKVGYTFIVATRLNVISVFGTAYGMKVQLKSEQCPTGYKVKIVGGVKKCR